ncbi:AI-2E family transporter [Sphingobacterium sp. LRF_L2]|uniref:AI-2E family transporter n=1 Tax=Sphingobacterium sp. LRF_L2 TaxID=3369421 RepID=UPI003F60213B
MMSRFFDLPFYLKLTCSLITLIAIFYIAKVGQTIIVPFILGSLFALLLTPLSSWLERKIRIPRVVAALLSLFLFFSLIVGVFTLLGSQMTSLKQDLPAFEKQVVDGFDVIQNWVFETFHIDYSAQVGYINDTLSNSVGQGTAILGVALLSMSSTLILLIFTFFYTFFMLAYRGHIVRFLLLLNKENDHSIVLEIIFQVQYVVKKYLIGLFLQMIIVAILTFIALSIIGVKYSLMLAIFTGFFNVLPYIGIFLALLVISLITFATSSFLHVLFVILAIFIIHFFDSNFVVPKIVGSKVKVNSMVAMMAIFCGELLWGISGMFLAIPVLAIVKIVFDRIRPLKPWGFLLGEDDNKEQYEALKKEICATNESGKRK